MTTPVPASCAFLPWDSEFFGVRIARLVSGKLTPDLLSEAMRWCESEKIECLYFLAESGDRETVRLAEDARFRFVDIRVKLTRELDSAPPVQRAGSVRLFMGPDLPALKTIARVGHRASRFFSDPRFGADAGERLFDVWIERSCRNPASTVLVAESEGTASGYCAIHVEDGEGVIGLIAVAPRMQGRGLGRDLIAAASTHFQQQGIQKISVVTQGRNIQGQKLYQRCGFITESVMLWYHKWF